MLFWTIVAIMLVFAVAALLPPLLRKETSLDEDTQSDNVMIARERLEEMEKERSAGIISQEIFDQEKDELELSLLDDVSVEAPVADKPSTAHGAFGLVLVLVLVPLVSLATYLSLGSPQFLDVKSVAGANPHAASQEKMPTMDELLATLEQRVKADPSNADDWYMLGRLYNNMGRWNEAAGAFEKLAELTDNHPAALLGMADALAMQNGGRITGRPYQLVLQALDAEPDNVTALWLAGKGASESGDYQNALYYWRQAEAGLAEEPEMLAEMQSLIADLKAAASQAGQELDDPGSSIPEQPAASGNIVEVMVSVAPELIDHLKQGDQLFVFARQPSGPPMPVAAVKRMANELPLTIVLDDNAVLTGGKLSDHAELTLAARITRDGEPTARSGDLQSGDLVISPATDSSVELVIDKVVP